MPSSASPLPVRLLAGALLAAIAAAVYLPIFGGGFIWDDNNFLTDNPLIRAPDGLRHFWFTGDAADYWPVTSTTLWLEWRLWGLHAGGYHVTNVALHALEVVLCWSTLRRLQVPGAFWGALLFAVHPVNVETVAWITQRKNLMAMLFFLLSLRAFLATSWAGMRTHQPRHPRLAYAASLIAFVLAMLAKGSVAPLPFVLLGIVAWRRRLQVGDLTRAVPYLAVAVALTVVNLRFQAHDYAEFRHVSLLERTLGAGAALWFYLGKALWPFGLSFVYPLWTVDPHAFTWWLPALLAVAGTVLLGWAAWRWPARWKGTAFTWAYYVTMLLPVLGFTDVGFMKFSLVADHYQHLALLGLCALGGSAAASLAARRPAGTRPFAYIGAAAIAAILGGLTFVLSATYASARALYEATLRHSPASSLAHNNLGIILAASDPTSAAAIENLTEALAADPRMAEAQYNLALILGRLPERHAEAVAHARAATALNPRLVLPHVALGNLLAADPATRLEAIGEYRTALRLRSTLAEAHYNLANALAADEADRSEAIAEYRATLALNPADSRAENNLANLVAATAGKQAEAVLHYRRALQLDPDNLQAHNNLANVLAALPGHAEEAVAQYEAALRLEPRLAQVHCNLANLLATLPGRRAEAAQQYREALQLDPNLEEARQRLALLPGGP